MTHTRIPALAFLACVLALAAVGCTQGGSGSAGEATSAFELGRIGLDDKSDDAGEEPEDDDADGGIDERDCDDTDGGPHHRHPHRRSPRHRGWGWGGQFHDGRHHGGGRGDKN